jgi:hypothetical protein
MANSEIYQRKLEDLDVISYDKFQDKELAERVYHMFLALQEQIDELRETNELKRRIPRPLSADSDDDPCCCSNPNRPPSCGPICDPC